MSTRSAGATAPAKASVGMKGKNWMTPIGFGQRGQSFAGVRVEVLGVDRVSAHVALDLAERDLAVRGLEVFGDLEPLTAREVDGPSFPCLVFRPSQSRLAATC